VAEWLGRGLQSLVQRFESARRLITVLVFALVVAACGAPEQSGLDAQQLVLQLSDLPPGYNLNSAESFPVRTSKILAEPFSASSSAIVRRERLSGYQAAFKSPLGQRPRPAARIANFRR
jgi:hypothetical protein